MPVHGHSFFCSAVLTPQYYQWCAATRFAFPGGKQALWVDYSGHELSRTQWALRQWSQLAEGWCTMMWKIAVFGIELTTYVDPKASALYPLHHSTLQHFVERLCLAVYRSSSSLAHFQSSTFRRLYLLASHRASPDRVGCYHPRNRKL